MKFFRQLLFWSHLAAGLIAGISIGIMCFTGAVLAFEHEIVEWTEMRGPPESDEDDREEGAIVPLPVAAVARTAA